MPENCLRCGIILVGYKVIALDNPYMLLYLCDKCDRTVYDTLDRVAGMDFGEYLAWLRDHAGQPAPHRLEMLIGAV